MIDGFDRFIWKVAGGLLLLLLLVILIGSLVGLQRPRPLIEPAENIGVWGPIELKFSEKMIQNSVEERFFATPEVEGKFYWAGDIFWFYPSVPMRVGGTYTYMLESGAIGESGRHIRRAIAFSYQVRKPRILFLSPSGSGAEIWIGELESPDLRQITQTNGSVYDFSVDRSGERIFYSVANEQDGKDIWAINPDGGTGQPILDCGVDWCTNPVIGGRGDAYLAYDLTMLDLGETQIWIHDMAESISTVLLTDHGRPAVGHDASWSPDGEKFSYFDTLSNSIRVIEIYGIREHDILLQSNAGEVGDWSPSGRKMVFANVNQTAAGNTYVVLYEADLINKQVAPLFDDDINRVDYSLPVRSPDEDWFALGKRYSNKDFSKQIWVLRVDGSQAKDITQNPSYTHGSYSWDPGGSGLVFQRLDINSSSSLPEVVVWQQDTDQFSLVAEDAYHPVWIP
jgi:TolB protein